MKMFIDTVENIRHNVQSGAEPSHLVGKDADCLNDDSYHDPTNNNKDKLPPNTLQLLPLVFWRNVPIWINLQNKVLHLHTYIYTNNILQVHIYRKNKIHPQQNFRVNRLKSHSGILLQGSA